ncbi:CehA/McbA family metallohydrolase [Rhodococcus qingshengii]|uniref:CehA/McbA family metallohydrolase n=1 Tax=Rhodococcus qingshengii TaxID=334542 RepID=UPI0028F257D9|nr:CehA/McbA family metallohydrolase [Rhodococcus qingshengii]MDT9659169.1 CehA/McbA family metallohydrolase [Rhodococcus qingshengii]
MTDKVDPVQPTELLWFRGDCHIHSIYSDGEQTPPELAETARLLGLHFVATTDHNTTAAHHAWQQENIAQEFAVILGEEVPTPHGHWLALGLPPGHLVDWQYADVVGLHAQRDLVHDAGGICVVAHPYAPYPSGTFAYSHVGFDAVEVWNGTWESDLPWQADNERALAHWARQLVVDVPAGRWTPAIGNSDTHLRSQMGLPHNVVAAERLNTDDLLTSIKAGRTWISAATTVDLSFMATFDDQCAQIGDELDTHGKSATVQATVHGVPFGTVTIHTDAGPIHSESLPGSGTCELSRPVPPTSTFVRAEVRSRTGHMAALSNPVILRDRRTPSQENL